MSKTNIATGASAKWTIALAPCLTFYRRHPMSELQDAIAWWDEIVTQPQWKVGWMAPLRKRIAPFVEAARLVANPNKDAVRRFVNGHGIYPFDLSEFVDGVVAAALTPAPGDTEQ